MPQTQSPPRNVHEWITTTLEMLRDLRNSLLKTEFNAACEDTPACDLLDSQIDKNKGIALVHTLSERLDAFPFEEETAADIDRAMTLLDTVARATG